VFPAVIALAAMGWAVSHPTVVCVSGGDTFGCTDYSLMKFFVATAGVGLAMLVAAFLGFTMRLGRTAIVAAVAVGVALISLAVVSQIRAVT
jgi:hypothetical protein